MKHIITALALASLATPTALQAEVAATPGKLDTRITYARFQQGQVYRINTRLRTVTLIELGDGERIQSIAIGDLESFKIDRLEGANVFIIKPVIPGAATNITVETNRNFYFLKVHETSRALPTYSLKFTVPGARNRTVAAPLIPALPPMKYRISRKTRASSFAPIRVGDNGRQTIFQFAPGAPIPAVFRADAQGREYTVNTSASGTTVTVGTISERWVLRVGDQYVCIQGSRK
ncbi:MAG: TrbG/VirB9 family P-type conjugative transfer protein [Halocynthiibacter sp.]